VYQQTKYVVYLLCINYAELTKCQWWWLAIQHILFWQLWTANFLG